MMGEAVGTEKAVEIIDIYTHKVEKRLDRLTYLVFIVIPLLLIIAMQLGALIIYLFNSPSWVWAMAKWKQEWLKEIDLLEEDEFSILNIKLLYEDENIIMYQGQLSYSKEYGRYLP